MKSKEDIAIEKFRSGLNCAQSVVVAFVNYFGYDAKHAMNLSIGFGGGIGRLQKTCGAISGAVMVLGMYNSNKIADMSLRKEQTYEMVQDFVKKFKKLNGNSDCRLLLNCDLNSEDGHSLYTKLNLREKVCEKCIIDAVRLLEELVIN
jgi:C_GCAxxG_C_C family probable redox protein